MAGRVVKRYQGGDAPERLRNEVEAIRRAAGRVPAPSVLDVDESSRIVTFARLPGRNGQELIDEGSGDAVLEVVRANERDRVLAAMMAAHA